MSKKLILVGGFKETIELCELCGYTIVGIIENNQSGRLGGYPILGTDAQAALLHQKYQDVSVFITPDQPDLRYKLAAFYASIGFSFASLISPKAFVSPSAHIGLGAYIQSFSNISSNVKLGDFVRINTYANIMHDADIGDCVTVAPNAVILGAVCVGAGAYIGANSTIIQSKAIGSHAVVGAGAVVTKNVLPYAVVAGVPAKQM